MDGASAFLNGKSAFLNADERMPTFILMNGC